MIIVSLTAVILLLGYLLYISTKKNLELMEMIDDVDEKVENCLDVLDACHQSFDLKLKMEVFTDEPVVKDLIQDIKNAKESVYLIAKSLNGDDTEKDEYVDEKDEEKVAQD